MKKSHFPQYPITQKVLEEQMKKLRKVRPSPYSEEPVQADINVGESSSKKTSEGVIYAEVNVGEPSGKPHPKPEETIYAEVNVGEPSGKSHPKPEETIYAEVNVGEPSGKSYPKVTVRAGASSQVRPTLTQEELARKLQKNEKIQYCQEQIRSLCEIVYGERSALDGPLNGILENSDLGSHLLYVLSGNPEIFGPFRGRQVLGLKSPARKRAEESSRTLCGTVEQYVGNVKQLIREIRESDYVKYEKFQKKSTVREHHYPTQEKQHTVKEQPVQQRRCTYGKSMAM